MINILSLLVSFSPLVPTIVYSAKAFPSQFIAFIFMGKKVFPPQTFTQFWHGTAQKQMLLG